MPASKSALVLVICVLLCGFALSCATGRPPIPVLPLVINPAALPAAVINVPYSATLTSTGGKGPFTWALSSGSLPPGLSISAGGVISGTPTALGTTTFKVQVTDSQTPTAAVDIATESITVNSPLAITTTSLTSGSVNVPYSGSLAGYGRRASLHLVASLPAVCPPDSPSARPDPSPARRRLSKPRHLPCR